MDDLISRQAAIDALNNILANYVPYLHGLTECIPLDCAVAIKTLPSAQPQRESAYLIDPNPYGKCSNCGQLIDIREGYNFCPSCGARLDGGIDG